MRFKQTTSNIDIDIIFIKQASYNTNNVFNKQTSKNINKTYSKWTTAYGNITHVSHNDGINNSD